MPADKSHLKVKLVPKLGPFAVAKASKKMIASDLDQKVIERSPPYPPPAVRHAS